MKNGTLMLLALGLLVMSFLTLGFILGFAIARLWAAAHAMTWALGVLVTGAAACALNIREEK